MNVTFYIFVGFLVGIAVMCAMVIAVSVSDKNHLQHDKPDPQPDVDPNQLVYRKRSQDHYTYNASGKKRKVKNVRYRDS